jgi:hypothetical protein
MSTDEIFKKQCAKLFKNAVVLQSETKFSLFAKEFQLSPFFYMTQLFISSIVMLVAGPDPFNAQ